MLVAGKCHALIGGIKILILLLLFDVPLVKCASLTSFRALYVRMPQMHLSTLPAKTIRNASVEACAELCVRETEFECKSFDLDNTRGSCRLQNHTHEEPFVTLQISTYADHYRIIIGHLMAKEIRRTRRKSTDLWQGQTTFQSSRRVVVPYTDESFAAYEKIFDRLPNHIVTYEHNRKIPGLTVEECARRCILEVNFRCRGFDYEVRLTNCWLTDLTPENSGGVVILPGTDFYERKLDGPLENFVNFGYGTLQQLEGIQIYNKIILGVTLAACAQLCLAETTFSCTSFDYVFNGDSCRMSQYISANVHGLSTSFSEDFRAMHYEVKEEFLDMFYATPYAAVLGNNRKTYRRVTPNNCARKCLQEREFVCRSFDYQIQDGTCMLSVKTGSDVGGLINHGFSQVHHFEMKPFLDCGGTFYKSEGDFASPNWPRNYYHNMECTWQIVVPKFRIIKLEFTHFDLGYHGYDDCRSADDKLLIIENEAENDRKVFCGDTKINTYVSATNKVSVTFISNSFQDAKGFRAFFHTDWPCGGTMYADNGMLSSPNWPNTYPPSTTCKWKIIAPVGAKIYLNLLSLDLERHMNGPCRLAYDVIEVFDGDSDKSPTLVTLCGRRMRKSVTSSNNVLFITFHSDDRVERKGFHGVYRFIYSNSSPSQTVLSTSAKDVLSTTSASPKSDMTKDDVNVSYDSVTTVSNVNDTKGNRTKMLSLAAMFIEPRRIVPVTSNRSMIATGSDDVTTDSVDNTETFDPTMHSPPEIVTIETDLRRVILVLTVAFFILFFTLVIILLGVCRHYRKRIPKRRNVTNFPFTEESVSLYDKDNAANDHVDDHCNDHIDTDINLPQPSPSSPPPDVTFCNPLYERRSDQNAEDTTVLVEGS